MRILALALIIFLQVPIAFAEESPQSYDGIPQAVIQKLSTKDVRGMFKVMGGKAISPDK